MGSVSLSWLVLDLTGSPFRLGLVNAVHFGPLLVLGLVAGALADRLPKRRTLLGTQAVLVGHVATLGVLVATGRIRYWHVLALAVPWGLVATLDLPARQAFVVELVGRDDVVSAVGLGSAAFNAARVIGPALAGLLIARLGTAPAFFLNAAGLLLVTLVLARLSHEGRPAPGPHAPMREAMLRGLRYVATTPRLVFALALLTLVTLTVFNFAVYVPLLARDVLGFGPRGFGLLMACLGVGSVAGALGLAALPGREPSLRLLVAAAGLAPVMLLALAVVRQGWLAAGAMLVLGSAAIVPVAGANTILQVTAPEALRARVVSLHGLIFGGLFPVGALWVGSAAEAWGVARTLGIAGAVGLLGLAALVAWWGLRARGVRPAERWR